MNEALSVPSESKADLKYSLDQSRGEEEEKMTKVKSLVLALIVVLATAGSSGAFGQQPSSPGQSSQATFPIPLGDHPRYVLQRQDVISLSFPLSPELNQSVTIQPDGYISLQNVGSIYAQGLTTPELVLALKKAYAGILHDPIIDVDLQDFQKPMFTVSGQVGKPGQYELRADITVAEALAVAGGMTALTAKTQVFLFHRTSKEWVEVKKVNLNDILKGKGMHDDALLQPGDMIYVPEKFISSFKKYVPYSFNFGTYLQTSPI